MKYFFYLMIVSGTLLYCNQQEDVKDNSFNASLAEKLGADDYGMKEYVMAFLKAGPDRSQDQPQLPSYKKIILPILPGWLKKEAL